MRDSRTNLVAQNRTTPHGGEKRGMRGGRERGGGGEGEGRKTDRGEALPADVASRVCVYGPLQAGCFTASPYQTFQRQEGWLQALCG